MIARPLIGTKLISPFKSKVISYWECDKDSVRVKKLYSNQEWIIDWRKAELLLDSKVLNYEI